MAKKNEFKKREGVVYSTDPEFSYSEIGSIFQETVQKNHQNLTVLLDRKSRAGKVVTLVQGFVGSDNDLKELAKVLKTQCGVGGSQKDGEIIIQGDFKERIYQLLVKEGYKVKKSGG
jgi:translation initiation factor 1